MVNIINGSNIQTSGIDINVSYDVAEIADGMLTLGVQGSYTIEYESDDFLDINGIKLSDGGDFVGKLNDGNNPFQSMPGTKANFSAKWVRDEHRVNLVARYITSYDDDDPLVNPSSLSSIDSQLTWDLHYNTTIMENLTLSASVINVADEDPPQAATDLNYDPYTHNPFGRMFKVGVRYTIGE